jgi:hypothetical protein
MVNLYQANPSEASHGTEKSTNNFNMSDTNLPESNWTSSKTSLKLKTAKVMKITYLDAIQPSHTEKLKKNVPNMEEHSKVNAPAIAKSITSNPTKGNPTPMEVKIINELQKLFQSSLQQARTAEEKLNILLCNPHL